MAKNSWEYVIKDMKKRNKTGMKEYGVPLTTKTEKDFLWETYEELLDAVVYLRTELLKREENKKDLLALEIIRTNFNQSIKDTEDSIFHPYPFSEK